MTREVADVAGEHVMLLHGGVRIRVVSTNPKTYGEVVAALAVWSAGVLLVLTIPALAVLPRSIAEPVLEFLRNWPYAEIAGPIVLAGVGAYVAIVLLKVHELYDTYVVHWRIPYDNDFILPTLLLPFANRVDPAFLDRARQERRYAMRRLYYFFVQDHDPRISVNYLVRFYQRLLRYWITQVNEIALLTFGLYCLGLTVVGFGKPSGIAPLLGVAIAAAAFLLQRRILVHRFLKSVGRSTEEEIDAIHEDHLPELEKQVMALHDKWGLAYNAP